MSDREYPSPENFQDPLENYEPKTYSDRLEEALSEEKVADIRHEPYATIPPEMPVHAAVEKLASMHVACLLVEQDRKLLGLFTERDILVKTALNYDQMKDQPVSAVMTRNPIYVYETDSPATAFGVMAAGGYRHVPVLNLDDELVGIVSPQRFTAFLHRYFES